MTAKPLRSADVALIVGHGLIGSSIHARLKATSAGRTVRIGRRQRALPDYTALDLATEAGRAALATVLTDVRPRCAVLAHGPSDVTWINENEAAAAATHCGVAEIIARSGTPTVLVSTDNVFAGNRPRCQPGDVTDPTNGYGRIKARAETILLETGTALVLRVSLVYGWGDSGLRPNFAERCLEAAARDRPMSAPTDQVFTPIHVRDVATAVAAVCGCSPWPAGIAHLAGPDELSRFEFATMAYRLAGADPALVTPCLRRETEWASRPQFSSLATTLTSGQPGPAAQQPLTPAEGLRDMMATRPAKFRGPRSLMRPVASS